MAERARDSSDETDVKRWILEAIESLLDEKPLHQLTIADILAESGMSRGTFYAYFSSKYTAVAAVVASSMDEMIEAAQPWLEDNGLAVVDTLRATLDGTAAAWETHGSVLRSLVENWHAVPELQEIWQSSVERLVDVISARIDADRAAGLAPTGINSRKLAAGLVWNGQQFFYLGMRGVDPEIPTIKDAVEAMYPMWLGAVYGHGGA